MTRFLIIGAGAIGGYVGGCLALAGHDLTFVARPTTVANLAAEGLRLTWARTGETRVARGFQVVTSVAAALSGPAYDCLILAVKAYDTEPTIQELQAITKAPPPILALQNGVDAEAVLAAAFGPQTVISSTVTTAMSKQASGLVIEKSRGMGIALGHPMSQRLAATLTQAGIQTRLYRSTGAMKWSKLLANLVGNASSAIVDLPVAALFADPRLYQIEKQTLRECLAVMRRLGDPVVDLPGTPARALSWAIRRLPDALARPLLGRFVGAGRGAKMPSLNLDVQAGRTRTEVRWLNGAVARHGAQLGIATPVNTVLTETVEALTAGRLKLADFRHNPEALLNLFSDLRG